MLKLLLLHWVLASTVMGIAHNMYILGFVAGAFVTGIAYTVYRLMPGSIASRVVIGISFMAYSLIFIQQHFGMIEMHFHIFVSMAFLIRYKDISPVIAASTFTALHHVAFNLAQDNGVEIGGVPVVIFNYGCGWDIVAIHATFVVAALIIYSYIILELTGEYIRNAQLFRILDHLHESAEQTNSAAESISTASQSLAMDARENSDKLQSNTQAMERMNSIMNELQEKTSTVNTIMDKVKEDVDGINKAINDLRASSNGITSIIKTIDEIAFQTNMLSLNAAVEAARAGASGAGFAVVADEVRVLATKSGEAAADITKRIEDNVKKAEQGDHASSQIHQNIKALVIWVDEVSQVTDQQLRFVEELNTSVMDIDKSTNRTLATAEKNAAASEELQSQVMVLRDAISDINSRIEGKLLRTTRIKNLNNQKNTR